jgi:betaine-aldehyde dehydrogenase
MASSESNSYVKARHWIDGNWMDSVERAYIVAPATGEIFGTWPCGGEDEARRAVAAAVDAFAKSNWAQDPYRRATVLSHLADAFEMQADALAEIVCRENGKLLDEARYEILHGVRLLRFSAGLPMQAFGRVLDPRPGVQSLVLRQPRGVAALLIPWNGPVYLFIRAVAAALAAGCTAVVKMPSRAAQIATRMSEICSSIADLPRGVLNVFIEANSEGSRFLIDCPEVKVVSFTGSTKVGAEIGEACGRQIKPVDLELGGKTPHVIFDDADLDAMLPVLSKSVTMLAGQFCMTASRIIVQRGIAPRLRQALASRLAAIRVGPSTDPQVDMGPLIDQAAVNRVDVLVEEAIAAGAIVLVRGGRPAEPSLAKGSFYRPCLLEVVDPSLPIVQEEIFGPVQTLQTFDFEEQAIALANDSRYGLGACIWSRDCDRPLRVARQLHAGLIAINGWANQEVELEDGGVKASGLGRMGGLACLEIFTEYKQITQNFSAG